MTDIFTADALFFFDGKPAELALYEALARCLTARYPEAEIRVQKTQIGFHDGGLFACASLLPVRRKAERPPVFITVSFGLPFPPESLRVVSVPVRASRYTCHVIIGKPEEIDDELLRWIDQSHAFAGRRRGIRRP